MSRLLTLISLLTFLLGACGSQQLDCARADVLCAGLVTDLGDVQSGIAREAWLGLQDAKNTHLVDHIDVIETVEGRDRAANIKAFADQGYDVIVTVGAAMGKDTTAAAQKYPDLHFIGIEQPQTVALPNLAGLVFDEDRSGFLAGALAALITQTGHVAAVCEPNYIDAMRRYCDGFEAGARFAAPHVKATVTYREGSPQDLFNAPDWGGQAASQQIHDGADVLFAAGGRTADGALQTAAAEGAYVIGSETDRYLDLPAIRPRLLTSATSDVRSGVLRLLKLLRRGEFPSGEFTGGIKLAPWHDLARQIPIEVIQQVQSIASRLDRGTLATGIPPRGP